MEKQLLTNTDQKNTLLEGKLLPYMPQLDSVRALAIFGVFISHYLELSNPISTILPWGWSGVRLFFVLSGFLITGILIKSRQKYEALQISRRGILKNFFIRRFLRLFPIYCLYLIASAYMFPSLREYLWVFILNCQNFLIVIDPKSDAIVIGHLWSLAVEAQFYLVMPAIVMFVPEKSLLSITIGMVITAPIFRVVGILCGLSIRQLEFLMPSNLDTLAMGSLLAMLNEYRPIAAHRLLAISLRMGIPLFLGCCFLEHFFLKDEVVTVLKLFKEVLIGLSSVAVVGYAAQGIKGKIGYFLSHPWLVYCGQISYGLYIYHFTVPHLLQNYIFPILNGNLSPKIPKLGIDYPGVPWFIFPIYVAISFVIAVISWEFFEQPINRLKYRFSDHHLQKFQSKITEINH